MSADQLDPVTVIIGAVLTVVFLLFLLIWAILWGLDQRTDRRNAERERDQAKNISTLLSERLATYRDRAWHHFLHDDGER